jgi:ABC-type antimicrobial peptide transport system permease subunit
LTIAGVAIGVGFIIFLVSLGFGLQRISTKQIANLDALQVIDVAPGKSKVITVDDQALEKFAKLSNVTDVEAETNFAGNLSYGSSTTEGVIYGKNINFLKMEEPELESGGIYENNLDSNTLINTTMLKRLGFKNAAEAVGKKIRVKMVIGADRFAAEDAKSVLKEADFVITGVMKNESSPYIYIPQEIFRTYGVKHYNMAKIRVKDKENVELTKKQLENLGYKSTSLKDTVDQINQFFTIFQFILVSFGAIAVLVAALGMFNTLTISLLEKTREISFMKIMGTTSRDIWNLFLAESMLIGFIGSAVGIGAGVGLGTALNNFLINLAEKTGNKPVQIFYTPLILIVLAFAVAIAISFLTGIYPSLRASRIDPLEAMRYE